MDNAKTLKAISGKAAPAKGKKKWSVTFLLINVVNLSTHVQLSDKRNVQSAGRCVHNSTFIWLEEPNIHEYI